MTGTGFVQTPNGEAWIDVAAVLGVGNEGDGEDDACRAFVIGPKELLLGTWETPAERDMEVMRWLLAVSMIRLGIEGELPEGVIAARAWAS